jgi:DNA repair protein RecO (recombination protein O)
VPQYRDEAVVLRTHKLGEVDRILTLLTKNHGQVRAVAKGVRKTTSRFGAKLEPFMVADLQLYEGKNLDTVTQVESLASYGKEIVADYSKYTAASAIVEAAEKLTRETSTSQHYALLLGALRALARSDHETSQILDSYLLRALALSGWTPTFDICTVCEANPAVSFSIHSGAVSCSECSLPGAVRLSESGIRLLAALVGGDWTTIESASVHDKSNASGVISAYLQWQLEKGLKSLNHVERD